MNSFNDCPDCNDPVSRRDFVRKVGTAALASGTLLSSPGLLRAKEKKSSDAEAFVKELYATLSDKQKEAICLPFDHPKRTRISANWAITEPRISDDFFTDEQRGLIERIFRGVSSADGFERFVKQTDHDSGGWAENHIAIFGNPEDGAYEWALTGRHITIRADGNSVEGMAFGGPLVYGHGESDPSLNLFHYQTKEANKVFGALEGEQRKIALLEEPPKENQVSLKGAKGQFQGIAIADLSSDQKELVASVIKSLMSPYRESDVEEVHAVLKQSGGIEKMHMAFYQKGDLKNDKVWDIWRLEGPSFVSHFRGAPHVHAYLNIGVKTA